MSQEYSYISLSLLNQLIKEVVQDNFVDHVWLVAEISDVKIAASGHCYMELIEKKQEKVVARIKANIWSFQYQKIAQGFYASTGKPLERGMKILLLASVGFHELYGVSLVVKNIDPTFTLGELAKNKQEIIQRLKNEGLLEVNKMLELELVPKRIAIISSGTAAGYEDFMSQLNANGKSYVFETTLFSASMQGDLVEKEVLEALGAVLKNVSSYDAVVIIRGGGASLDLTAFDNYRIAKMIANFPLPVVVGIGHERDSTVVDLVAHTSLKTPTAVASFFIAQFEEFEAYTQELSESLVYLVKESLFKEKHQATTYRSKFALLCQSYLTVKKEEQFKVSTSLKLAGKQFVASKKQEVMQYKSRVSHLFQFATVKEQQSILVSKSRLTNSARSLVEKNKLLLKNQERTINLLDPINVLNRGYAMVLSNREYIKSKAQLKIGDELSLVMKDGSVKVKVNEK
ncbi:MAG: exodeoxyribonuclease VII large subunit [Saprospiraceae bacterium]|jgi:exodeoxyribonuclease VII large subunit